MWTNRHFAVHNRHATCRFRQPQPSLLLLPKPDEVKSLGLSATWHLNRIGSYNYDYIWVYRIEGNATGGVKVDMGRKESLNTLTSSRLISAVQTLTSVLPSPPPPFQNKRTFHHWSSRARPDVKRNLAGGERRVA